MGFTRYLRHMGRALAGAALAAMSGTAAMAGGNLRIGMTIADIPITTGQTDQGGEGQRFLGYTLYDALINWDLSSADKASVLTPGLATSWKVDPQDSTKWLFTLRRDVHFHDGSLFDANAVAFNLAKLLDPKSPQYDPKQAAQGRSRIPSIVAWKVIDPSSIEITTGKPDALLPYEISWILMSSPAQWEKSGRDWNKDALQPSGTGPWKMQSWTSHQQAVLVPNKAYWDPNRVPKLDSMTLIPMPDAATRTAALRAGQVDWIEAPAPDAVPSLKSAGFVIVSNAYPHNWTWHLSRLPNSCWNDVRVRQAANLAIDRAGLKRLLGGLMLEAKGFVPSSSPWFGHPSFDVHYDPAAAKKLLAEAGYGPDHPVDCGTTLISASGSGQMQPIPMNEYIQQNLADVGIKVALKVLDWNALINVWRAGAKSPLSLGASAINFSYFIQDPFTAFVRHVQSSLVAPQGTNWGYYSDPKMDDLLAQVQTTFDPAKQDALLQKVHEMYVDDALFLMVAHDVNPRAMSSHVHGFIQAQNWFQNFSSITMQ